MTHTQTEKQIRSGKDDKKHGTQRQERSGKDDKRMGCIDRNAWDMEGRKED